MQKFIKEGNVDLVQGNLIIHLEDVGRGRQDADQIRQMANQAAKLMPDLWEPYQENGFARGMTSNKEEWTDKYKGTQQVYLEENFSKERFDHLVDVYEYLNK